MATSSKLKIMDSSGHLETEWEKVCDAVPVPAGVSILDLPVAPDQEKARELFGEYQEKGYMAFEIIGSQKRITNEFNPLADTIIMSPRLAGG